MNRISLSKQAGALKSYFPESEVNLCGEYQLSWVYTITPTPLSESYKIKLCYQLTKGVQVYVMEPKPLRLALGKKILPHVYSSSEQRLCLFYPKGFEWNDSMWFVQTIIPWTSEWLFHYEIWAGTGEWKGGGIHHENEAEIGPISKKAEITEMVM